MPNRDAGRRLVPAAIAILLLPALAGCVRRTIRITSDPSGALVWLNDREIGRTPVDVDFVYHGEYDVRLVRDGYEPLMTSGATKVPIWDQVPLDLVAELIPVSFQTIADWHYVLEPTEPDPDTLRADVIERARALRGELADVAPADAGAPKSP